MITSRQLLLLAVSALLAGCVDLHSVIFVTDTSIGINVDSKPPTTSIAYDRTEGYLAPRYDNGALPPVVATVGTGGTIFNPKIRQVYATGAAAVRVTNTTSMETGPTELPSDPAPTAAMPTVKAQKRLAFFGTSTTVGVKIGWGGEQPYPDSLVFGYRRKELSVLPLICKSPPCPNAPTNAGGQPMDVYPSVLASIDSTLNVPSRAGTGLEVQQFFATGEAAVSLATNKDVQRAFSYIAESSTAITPEQIEAARSRAVDFKPDDSSARISAWLFPGAMRAPDGTPVDAAGNPVDANPTRVAALQNWIANNLAGVPIATFLNNGNLAVARVKAVNDLNIP